MNEFDKDRTNFEPNFVLQPDPAADAEDAVKADQVTAETSDVAKAGQATAETSDAAKAGQVTAETTDTANPDIIEKPEAASDPDELMSFIFGENGTETAKQEAAKAEAAAEAERADAEAAAKMAEEKRAEAIAAAEKADAERAEAAAKRVAAMKAKAVAEAKQAVAEAQEKTTSAASAQPQGRSESDRPAGEKKNLRPESAVSEVLKAAAAKADALKAVAVAADQAGEPYRRETSTLSDLEDPVFAGMAEAAEKAEANARAAQRTNADADVAAAEHAAADTESGYSASGTDGINNTDGIAGNGFVMHDAGQADSSEEPHCEAQMKQEDSAGSDSFGSSAGNYNGASRFNSTAGAGYSAGAGNRNNAGPVPNGRPRFENPSFDPGQTGRYTDPRDHFRAGESASWSNGEVHRNRRQMKESIHKQKKQKKPAKPVMLTRKSLGLLVAGCLCLSCLTGLGGAALGTTLVQHNQANTAQTTTAAATADHSGNTANSAGYSLENATGSDLTIKEITSATQNSVVEIRTESVASDSWMQQYVTQGAGSGVIISDDGYIMTNNHVIEGASKIKVTTADEKEYEAKLVGTDETNDVAVLKIQATGLTPVTYGNSDNLEVGDMAVAIGNPLGELGGTVTAGIISATDRELSIDGKTMHLLQTDSSINPGNSGGGLFNGDGQLIGLVVAKSSGSDVEGLGFAIPINTAADVAKQLIEKGYVSGQPSTGMTYQEGSASNSGNDSFSSFDSFFGGNTATGVFIYSVNGENAKKAGFQAGDQVYAVDGKEITSFDELSSVITSHKVGDKVKFTIIRNGTQKNINLELEEKTASNQNQAGQNDPNGQDQQNQADPGNGQNNQELPDQGQGEQNFGNWQDWFNMFF